MLTIQNIENTMYKQFSFLGNEWVLYGVDVSNIEYKFIFLPMDYQTKNYDMSKAQIVLLDRTLKSIGNVVLGYRLWTSDGSHAYIDANDIPNWKALVGIVYKHKMIYANNTKHR